MVLKTILHTPGGKMRFLKTFFRFFTIVTLCSTFTGAVWGYASRSNKASDCSDYTTRSTCNAAHSNVGCVWTSSTNSTGSYCEQGYCVSTNCANVPGCNRYTLCEACNEGYYCPGDDGKNYDYNCGTGHYCPTGSASPTPCQTGTYNPNKNSTAASDCTSCPAGYPSSAAGSDASSDCYYNIPAGYEYDTSTSTNITCHAGGYCPGVKIFYNAEKKDEWGWDSCNGSKFKNENTGLTPTSKAGATAATNCYVICPDETIANGSVVPYNNTTYPSNMYATQTGTNQFTYSKCKYKLTSCNSGYTKSNEIDTLSNLKCNIVTYTITYKVGGDDGDITLTNLTPASYTVETATFNLPTTTLTGHTFAGWYTTKAFSGTAVSQITKGSTGNKTFYVKFTPNTYKLSYNLNGGTSGGTQPATAIYNSEFTVSNPTRTGYTFAGWDITDMDSVTHTYGSSTTTNTTISATKATTFKNLHSTQGATVTFTAKWTPNTYNLSYNLNGGTSGGTQPPSAKYNEEFTVSNPTRTGYTFAGWDITNMNSGVTHTYGSSTTTNTTISATKATTFKNLHSTQGATVTFTAKWTANTYNLSYNLNGGTSGGTQPATATFDKQFTVSNPTRTGYTFAGWDITNMNSGVTHTYGSYTTTNTSISATKATTFKNLHSTQGAEVKFTATWSANRCAITYSCGDGSGTPPTVATQPIYDASYTTAGLGDCKKPGYYFTGWKVGNTDTILAPSTITTKWQYETTTLTAQWAGCTVGHFCTGEKTQQESCATAFTSDDLATKKELCYLNPELKLKDTINTEGVSLKTIYTGKIYFKGNSS